LRIEKKKKVTAGESGHAFWKILGKGVGLFSWNQEEEKSEGKLMRPRERRGFSIKLEEGEETKKGKRSLIKYRVIAWKGEIP